MALIEFKDLPDTTTPLNASNLNNNFNELDNKIDTESETLDNKIKTIGKLLWSGSFTSGSITVDGLSNYTAIAVDVSGVLCYGNASYGGCSFGAYGNYGIGAYAYRFTVNGDTLTIDENSKGGTSGGANMPVTAIYGLF